VRRSEGADPVELRSLYERRLGDFRRVATVVAGSAEDGADAVQEAFAKALSRRRQYRGESPLEAWVWRIVLNEATSRARGRRRRVEAAAVGAGGGEADVSGRAEVRAALARLPERERLALFLRYFADLDYAQIAAVLDVASGTVGASLHSGRAKLGRLLREGEAR
jgi:RNA polymerase sigma-70 factor, ECF subfamily